MDLIVHTMSSSSQSKQFLSEGVDLLSATAILGFFYGLTFTLYCFCARQLYLQLQESDKKKQTRFILGYISLLLFLTTSYFILCAGTIEVSYVNHANFPGGPVEYEGTFGLVSNVYWTSTGVLNLVIDTLTMAIQVCC